jgi:hypothetical protein
MCFCVFSYLVTCTFTIVYIPSYLPTIPSLPIYCSVLNGRLVGCAANAVEEGVGDIKGREEEVRMGIAVLPHAVYITDMGC